MCRRKRRKRHAVLQNFRFIFFRDPPSSRPVPLSDLSVAGNSKRRPRVQKRPPSRRSPFVLFPRASNLECEFSLLSNFIHVFSAHTDYPSLSLAFSLSCITLSLFPPFTFLAIAWKISFSLVQSLSPFIFPYYQPLELDPLAISQVHRARLMHAKRIRTIQQSHTDVHFVSARVDLSTFSPLSFFPSVFLL